MPPADAITGKAKGPDGVTVQVAALTDEDRFTIVRWIDLGCPIDLDYDPAHPEQRNFGWMLDDNRPTLTVTSPEPGANGRLDRILIGTYDYYSGIDVDSFSITADFPINGIPAGQNLAKLCQARSQGVWELILDKPIRTLPHGNLNVSVKDKQGNLSEINRTFSVTERVALR